MKIIAKTNAGYLVEMTSGEIAKAAGYTCTYDKDWMKALRRSEFDSNREPVIGMNVDVNAAYDFHSRVSSNEAKAKEAAGTLRAIANLLDGAMPSVVISPAVEMSTSKEAGSAK